MAIETPDFRKMTPQDLRDGTTALNKIIKAMRNYKHENDKRLIVGGSAGAMGALVAGLMFPPAALIVAAGATIINMPSIAGSSAGAAVLKDAVELRRKFKEVWRARPGRPFRDVAARIKRTEERRKLAKKKGVAP